MALSKIMVVLEPATESQPSFERALDSAEITGAALHVYICLNSECGEGNQESIVAQYDNLLSSLKERAEARGVKISSETEWNEKWRQQVVEAGNRCGADLIIKHSVDHSDVDRAKRRTADWSLLREAKCSVLMIKDHTKWVSRRVVGAVIHKPADSTHKKLNDHVVEFVNNFADSYGSDAHYVTAYQDRNKSPDAQEMAHRCKVEIQNIHTGFGHADEVITDTARKIEADLIVIGTVGRSGIKGTVVGNTSERLLDHTHCDVLVLR